MVPKNVPECRKLFAFGLNFPGGGPPEPPPLVMTLIPPNIQMKVTPLDSLHTTEVVQAFYCKKNYFDQKVKKKQKSISQNISIFHPTNKLKVFLI